MAPKKRPASSIEDSYEEIILAYMKKQNRPYSLNDIVTNLHSQVKKTGGQRALESLVAQGLLNSKTYGKQVVYCYSQDLWDEVDSEKLNTLDQQIEDLDSEIKTTKEKMNELDSVFNGLNSTLSDGELDKRIAMLEQKVEEDSKTFEDLQQTKKLITNEERDEINKNYNDFRKHWKKYKSKFKDIFDVISENITISNNEFREEHGIEMDEDHNVDIKKDLVAEYYQTKTE